MQNYKVTLRDDSVRDVKADSIQIETSSVLWFVSAEGERFMAVAPGEWRSVEMAPEGSGELLPVAKKAAKK